MKILRGGGGGGKLRKFLDTQKGGSEKIVRLGGAPKICMLKNQKEGEGAPEKLNR